jgi:hypothetical protein
MHLGFNLVRDPFAMDASGLPSLAAEEALIADVEKLPVEERERVLDVAVATGRIRHPSSMWQIEQMRNRSSALRQRMSDARQKVLSVAKNASIGYSRGGA